MVYQWTERDYENESKNLDKRREEKIKVENQEEGGQLQQEKLKELSSDQVIPVSA